MVLPSTMKQGRLATSGKIMVQPIMQQKTPSSVDDYAFYSSSSLATKTQFMQTKKSSTTKKSLHELPVGKSSGCNNHNKDCMSLDGGSVHSTASFVSQFSVQSAPMAVGPIRLEGVATASLLDLPSQKKKKKKSKRSLSMKKANDAKKKKPLHMETDAISSQSRQCKSKRDRSRVPQISMEVTARCRATKVRFQGEPPTQISLPSTTFKKKSNDWTRYWYTQEEIDHFRNVHFDTAIQQENLLDHTRVALTARFAVNDVYQVCRFVPNARMPKLTTSQKRDLIQFFRSANGETVGLEYQFLTQGQVRSQRRQALYKVIVHDPTTKTASELRQKSRIISHQARFFAAHIGMAQAAATMVPDKPKTKGREKKQGARRTKSSTRNNTLGK